MYYRIKERSFTDNWGEYSTEFCLQERRWWGWKTLQRFLWFYNAESYCSEHNIILGIKHTKYALRHIDKYDIYGRRLLCTELVKHKWYGWTRLKKFKNSNDAIKYCIFHNIDIPQLTITSE